MQSIVYLEIRAFGRLTRHRSFSTAPAGFARVRTTRTTLPITAHPESRHG